MQKKTSVFGRSKKNKTNYYVVYWCFFFFKEKKVIKKALKHTFSPEFLNRVDECVIFNSLTIGDINKIVDIELSSLIERVKKLGYSLTISKKAKDFICEKGFDEKNGARPLNRMIQKYIEDLIAKNLVSNKIKAGDNLLVDYKSNSNELKSSRPNNYQKITKSF